MIARPARASGLAEILELQRANLEKSVSREEARSQGFVTVVHDLATLQKMHELAPSIVALASPDDDTLLGYALTMPRATRALVPILDPMFAQLEEIASLKEKRWYVMGQICVARQARGQGIFAALYDAHAKAYADQFDFIVTEIADRNTRSMRAHERQGFKVIHSYSDATDDWSVVAWDFGAGK
jgi:GNAT superfamily N-acetyltransferase